MAKYINVDYIPKDEFFEGLSDAEKAKVLQWFIQAPSADVEPVRYGKWIWINQATGYMEPPYGDTCKCSECGFIIDVSETHFKHCPECCAKMTRE